MTGLQLDIGGGVPVFGFASYHKGGLDDEIMLEIFHLTRRGAVSFFCSADWNEDPPTLAQTRWLDLLDATVIVLLSDNGDAAPEANPYPRLDVSTAVPSAHEASRRWLACALRAP